MEPKDFLEPRIFLCKSSRFLRNLNAQVEPDGQTLPPKELFGTEKFEETCDPKDLEPKDEEENENSNQDSDYDESSTDTLLVRILLCYLFRHL